jgi:c-di-GMP-binding flagellar brake protein YcgR
VAFLIFTQKRGGKNMQEWTKIEKRRAPRFEIDIPIAGFTYSSNLEFQSKIRDISAWGMGMIVPRNIPVGSLIDIVLMMPEKQDQVRLKGKIIWVQSASLNKYRVGAQFLADNFNPIPYVLKTLHHRAMARFPYHH